MKSIDIRNRKNREAISTSGLSKVYPNGTVALKGVSVAVNSSDFCVIIGLSGAGKSTLLRCMNRLIRPTAGSVALFGEDVTRVNGGQLRQVRRRVGMIFQQFNLVRRLTVLDNVLVGRLRFNAHPVKRCMSMFRQFSRREREFAFDCLQQVGIADLAFRRADALSGGQQQRVAIARALAQEPEVFLADEPIASLDPRSSETVMQILSQIHEDKGIPVLVNLHHIDFAQRYGKRILGMSKGELIFDGTARDLDPETVSCIYGDKAEEALEELSAA
ncbi:MAG: phosphonate ABC transporter ATP-binding protein [Pseudodesulfovibrio sp.]|jgi:phosphonate transport system ATP-binding protein|uniref:Phosphonate transport system ATP-binding protein n=1 Tax=Pseudodesulfovibrio indicus TaxID=1716143 RepID=A0AA94TJQ1_9BACT|nr:phosphonate ABC transporter ATP-binding protein [Pseudodesulfovibrio indicus]TDT87922.1 phosphonate transport system ATP-binding protein [Pseudodesulfovibrio indicus]